MYLKLDDIRLPGAYEETTSATSRSTGRELRRGEIRTVKLNPATHALLEAKLTEAQAGGSPIELFVDEELIRCKPLSRSASSDGEGRWWAHTIQVEEVEVLKVESVEMLGLKLQPYLYKEEEHAKGLAIDLHVEADPQVSREILDALRGWHQADRARIGTDLPRDYFAVVRRGISDQPLMMRFSQCLWASQGKAIKYRLALVERTFDEAASIDWPLLTEHSNLLKTTGYEVALVETILDELIRKKILSRAEVTLLKGRAQRQAWDRQWELSRVNEID